MQTPDDLPCREFVELVTDYLESTMPADLCVRFEAHLEVCEGCRLYLGQMRLTIRALQEKRDRSVPEAATERLLQRFRAWRAEGRPGAPKPGAAPRGVGPMGRRRPPDDC